MVRGADTHPGLRWVRRRPVCIGMRLCPRFRWRTRGCEAATVEQREGTAESREALSAFVFLISSFPQSSRVSPLRTVCIASHLCIRSHATRICQSLWPFCELSMATRERPHGLRTAHGARLPQAGRRGRIAPATRGVVAVARWHTAAQRGAVSSPAGSGVYRYRRFPALRGNGAPWSGRRGECRVWVALRCWR